ncbi:hypothetical protein F0562_012405 [Nyssa sinensis]|uniref:VQ domain-containing protein n=1 Tax=Nyssa sinensis TaxID=561372 RepID=A0A5J4ZWF3_9ASTE|nr:hypothetical protein F0562_012405 [Nyssa sinensis]
MEKHSNAIMAPPSLTPTTFVQADTTTFRELVQKLTGASGDPADKLPVTLAGRLSSKTTNPVDATGIRRSSFKLQERRNTMRKLEIKPGPTSRRNLPLTRVGAESPSSPAVSEEEKAIAERGFYLHPSPLSTPRKSEPPELLTLFPLTSPRQQVRDS